MELVKEENPISLTVSRHDVLIYPCDSPVMRAKLLSIMSGKECCDGECIVENISSKDNKGQYKKVVDCVDPEEIDSDLSVRDYLLFYAMISNNYTPELAGEIDTLLRKCNRENILLKGVNELLAEEKIMVRCIASYIKGIKLLIGNCLLEKLDGGKREVLISFLNFLFSGQETYCVLLEDK